MSGKHFPSGEPSQPQQATDDSGAPETLRDEVAHLHEAMKSQRDIGMAIGLVSARFSCSTEQAWRTILRVSQDSNTKVREVARVLVSTHDGSADAESLTLLGTFVHHLPPSGWPVGTTTGDDAAP
ncbi:ANTAR domain-containing protein [Nocardioides alpinus]|uniref:ANTAR domain-containing protein n=1 Tax=Nocardioides alpinus TaxID=748909 RepID=A0A1I0ZI91_9ACTN|nr:ANTAR domain-containing protein [Nocardioides alpinus]PKH40624.1 ANTAR domain-containing protein [Nocardioides alpinus]SFB24250.1 ANTAR domain-containing protein [Nocardioides alpinus]